MSWVCPWCGHENENDDKVGRQEPKCLCGKKRTTPEELDETRQDKIKTAEDRLEKTKNKITLRQRKIANFRDRISEQERKIKDLKEEIGPHLAELNTWKFMTVHYDKLDKAYVAMQAKDQTKLFDSGVPA